MKIHTLHNSLLSVTEVINHKSRLAGIFAPRNATFDGDKGAARSCCCVCPALFTDYQLSSSTFMSAVVSKYWCIVVTLRKNIRIEDKFQHETSVEFGSGILNGFNARPHQQISKHIEVYEESSIPLKQSFLITIKFQTMLQTRIIVIINSKWRMEPVLNLTIFPNIATEFMFIFFFWNLEFPHLWSQMDLISFTFQHSTTFYPLGPHQNLAQSPLLGRQVEMLLVHLVYFFHLW